MIDSYIDTTAIFGEVKKYVLSKDFKFGKLTNIFGATKVDFSCADINGEAILVSTQLFGEIRIKVPANWRVISDVTNIFAEVKDKRKTIVVNNENNKILILRGLGIFAEIKIVDCVN